MSGVDLIKVGVVGCGAIAQIMHLPHIKDFNRFFDLKAICDYSINLMNSIGEKYGIDENSRYIDYTAFLESDIDAVFVLTEGSHAPLVSQALKAEKHVFCEKPLCFTVKEAEEIEEILEKTDKIVMVGYMKRYDPGFKYALDLAKQIENPRYTQVTVLHPNEQQYFDIHGVLRFDDVPKDVTEANAREQNRIVTSAVGSIEENLKYVYHDAMLSSMVHNINVIRAMFGEPVGVLSTQIWPVDSCYPTITTVLDYGETHHIVLTWSYLSGVRNYVEELSIHSDCERIKVKFSSPFLKNVPTIVSQEYMQEGALITSEVEVSYDNAFKEELLSFYQCVTTNKSVTTDVLDAKADIKLLQSILATNRPKGLGGEALDWLITTKNSE
ncbi:Gfo/Idh/MocA family protein [Photorhabdus heterorhabditis]|uniref:Gfo/Idh/MocA family protein n=1 Tax=Photorhabdus heterorhabditis TaxID=880156 RepID=UPI001561B5E4|nr:Gfo/Idh/MocA family oxidoreductase [Photorhabdus heterorhabditis]NRN27051.1 Gfo/Idh/MocA family oxidoreductase [Photorhabdus heterorhabditis subsp. aluminescens]